MAATALTIISVVEAGVALATAADVANGNSFLNTNGDVMLYLQNTHATNAQTFNIAVQNVPTTARGQGNITKTSPLAISVPALSAKLVGPFPTAPYNDGSGNVQITFSGTGTPLIQAFKVSGMQVAT